MLSLQKETGASPGAFEGSQEAPFLREMEQKRILEEHLELAKAGCERCGDLAGQYLFEADDGR